MFRRTTCAFRLIALVLASLSFAIQLEGCATVGGPPKSLESAGTGDEDAMRTLRLERVGRGASMTLTLRDGTRRAGKFRGVTRIPGDAYASRYRAAAESLGSGSAAPAALPALGSRVTLISAAKPRAGIFQGFGFRTLFLVTGERPREREIRFDEFDALQSDGGAEWSRARLLDALLAGELPVQHALDLEAAPDAGREAVPVDRIESVTYRNSRTPTIVAAVVVVSMVAIVIAGFGAQPERRRSNSAQCTSTSYAADIDILQALDRRWLAVHRVDRRDPADASIAGAPALVEPDSRAAHPAR